MFARALVLTVAFGAFGLPAAAQDTSPEAAAVAAVAVNIPRDLKDDLKLDARVAGDPSARGPVAIRRHTPEMIAELSRALGAKRRSTDCSQPRAMCQASDSTGLVAVSLAKVAGPNAVVMVYLWRAGMRTAAGPRMARTTWEVHLSRVNGRWKATQIVISDD